MALAASRPTFRPGAVAAALGLALLAGALGAAVVYQGRHPGLGTAAAAECGRAYRRAGTARDTAAVDSRRVATGRAHPSGGFTCGTLRRLGETR